jgi:hypothetical protein
MKFAEEAIADLPTDYARNAKAGTLGYGAAVYIDFSETVPMQTVKDLLIGQKLTHTHGDGDTRQLRVSTDVAPQTRYKAKVIGELWSAVEEHLQSLPKAKRPANPELSCNSGRLYIGNGDRPVELFGTRVRAGVVVVEPVFTALAKYGIQHDVALKMVASAEAASARLVR